MGANHPPRTDRARPAARRNRKTLALAIVGAAAAGIGCSVEKNYELLSFFFDGVPPPQSAEDADADGSVRGGAGSRTMVSAHQAYRDRRCTDCHGSSSQFGFFSSGFGGLDAGLCVQCHADVVATPARLHGPVAAMACLWCHDPHESRYPSLLVDASPALCLGCHQMQLQGAPLSPGHEPPEDCLACHGAHGGAERYFLHPPPDEAPPAEMPPQTPPDDTMPPGTEEP